MDKEQINLEPGRIYFFSYGQTTVIGRYKGDDVCNHLLHDYLHNWQGYERFHKGPNCWIVKNDIKEIREASDAEKQSLLRHSIANHSI